MNISIFAGVFCFGAFLVTMGDWQESEHPGRAYWLSIMLLVFAALNFALAAA